jgi:hypothetical protein
MNSNYAKERAESSSSFEDLSPLSRLESRLVEAEELLGGLSVYICEQDSRIRNLELFAARSDDRKRKRK